MNLTPHEFETLVHQFRNHSILEELRAMKQDIADKFAALAVSQTAQTSALADITNTVHAAETLLDGLVASSGGGATTDADVLAALDAVKQQLDAKNAEIAALKDELAAKVVADTPA